MEVPPSPMFEPFPFPMCLQCIKSCVVKISLCDESSDDRVVMYSCSANRLLWKQIVYHILYITSRKADVTAWWLEIIY